MSLDLPHPPGAPQLAATLADRVPAPVREIAGILAGAGHVAAIVGGGVRDELLGVEPSDFDLATSAAPEAMLALFPRAIPIGLRHGTVMVPSAAGPVDITRFRAGSLREDLARRDFTINAMALELGAEATFVDPTGGHADLAGGVLRAPGDADARLEEDPLRCLRAARFVAQLGVEPDAELRRALSAHAAAVRNVAGERIRAELERLLLGPHVARGLELLREIGIEPMLVTGVRPDAARVTAAAPAELGTRLTAWLRETSAGPRLRKLRFPRDVADRVERQVAAHPAATGRRPAPRCARRGGSSGTRASRRCWRSAAPRSPPTRTTSTPQRRPSASTGSKPRSTNCDARVPSDSSVRALAATGEDVMRWLGWPPGPQVGRALRWLTERVAEDMARNEPAKLRALLADFPGADDAPPGRPPNPRLDAPKGEG